MSTARNERILADARRYLESIGRGEARPAVKKAKANARILATARGLLIQSQQRTRSRLAAQAAERRVLHTCRRERQKLDKVRGYTPSLQEQAYRAEIERLLQPIA